MDILNLIIPTLTILISLGIGTFVILKLVETKLETKLKTQKKDRNIFYLKKIKEIKKQKLPNEKTVEQLNGIARDFFKEAFKLNYNLEYSKIINEFKNKGKKECLIFSTTVSEILYSGKKIEKNKIDSLVNSLEKIIQQNQIISKEEEEENNKKIDRNFKILTLFHKKIKKLRK